MSSKLTELTESSPSVPPPSVLLGSGILSQFSSLSMASSGHFNPTQIYDGYKEKPFHQTGKQASNFRRYFWSKKDGPFGKEFLVSEPLNLDVTSGYSALTGSRQRYVVRWANVGGPIPVGVRPIYSSSEVPISRIIIEGIVKRIRQIADSHLIQMLKVVISWMPPAKRLQSKVIPSSPRNFQPTLATIATSIPPASPHSSHTMSALNPAVRPSPVQQSRSLPIVNSQQLQPVASTSRRREELPLLLFPAAQVFQPRDQWPIRVTREHPNMASDNQDAVARLFRRVDMNSREVIMYAYDRTIPGTASEEMAGKSSWYEFELINDFQKHFDYLGRDNEFPFPFLCLV
ncbi:hypothetical protein O181_007282 [Austropuccinia psidii MF-1]|uniref:Uncharacterized protein n=1 Tax=Austropuccinia psidii MF-1 TaxID=1389203 RepID=A0A9Q3BMF7_9BASI|nr:hypothetical protein [Austropuccinia psidii MF-1]